MSIGGASIGRSSLGGTPATLGDLSPSASLFWVVYPGAGAQPTAIQIRSGLQADNSLATDSGFEASPTSSTTYTFATGADSLTAGTQYRAAFVWSDGTSDSNIVVTDIFTTTAEGAASGPTPAGKSAKRRRPRYQVEVDGEVFDADSPEEAKAIIEQAKEEAEKNAALAVDRAAKAVKRPTKKVLRDASKALELPTIKASPALASAASAAMDDIRRIYAQAMRDIEISALMRQRERELEEDDEDVLMLL